jgi:hypothetical protein
LFFDINAKLEEQKKGPNQVTLAFDLAISTKPNVVKYSISGVVTLTGKPDDVKKKLEVNPKTNIPQILFTIYQHVFNSIYMLSSTLNTPYPPPDLLHPMAEKIQILSGEKTLQEKEKEKPAATASPAQTGTAPPTQTGAPAATPANPSAPAPAAPASPAPPAQGEQQASPK